MNLSVKVKGWTLGLNKICKKKKKALGKKGKSKSPLVIKFVLFI